MKTVLIVALLVAALVAVLIIVSPRTRVTEISRKRERDDREDQD